MEVIWYVILCFMLVMYIVLDGFDFGAGIIHFFFAKTDAEKKQVMRAISPFLDGN
jgi:cytochrome d ubiquinol oxidase subunit II